MFYLPLLLCFIGPGFVNVLGFDSYGGHNYHNNHRHNGHHGSGYGYSYEAKTGVKFIIADKYHIDQHVSIKYHTDASRHNTGTVSVRSDGTAKVFVTGKKMRVSVFAKTGKSGQLKQVGHKQIVLKGGYQVVHFEHLHLPCSNSIQVISENGQPILGAKVIFAFYGYYADMESTNDNGKICIAPKYAGKLRAVSSKAGFVAGVLEARVSKAHGVGHKKTTVAVMPLHFKKHETLKVIATYKTEHPYERPTLTAFQFPKSGGVADCKHDQAEECSSITAVSCESHDMFVWRKPALAVNYLYVVAVYFSAQRDIQGVAMYDNDGHSKIFTPPKGNSNNEWWLIGCVVNDDLKTFSLVNKIMPSPPDSSNCFKTY